MSYLIAVVHKGSAQKEACTDADKSARLASNCGVRQPPCIVTEEAFGLSNDSRGSKIQRYEAIPSSESNEAHKLTSFQHRSQSLRLSTATMKPCSITMAHLHGVPLRLFWSG